MAENTVNTMVISVDKFEQLNNEVSIAKANADACKDLLTRAINDRKFMEKQVEELTRKLEEDKQVEEEEEQEEEAEGEEDVEEGVEEEEDKEE